MNTQNESAVSAQVPPLATESPLVGYLTTLCNKKGIKVLVKYKKAVSKLATVQDVNQYFFEVVLPEKDTAVDDLESLKDHNFFKNKLFQNERDRQIVALSDQINSARSNAIHYMNEGEKYLANVSKLTLNRELLLNKPDEPDKLFTEIKKIVQSGFFVFEETESFKSGGTAYFKTKPVFLSFKDTAAGIDIKDCPMGSYKVAYNLSSGTVHVKGGARSLHGHCHPHVGTSGGICWGNAKEAYLKAVENRDISTVMGLVHSVLSTYNAGSPYVSLIDYDVAQNPNKYPITYKQEGSFSLYFSSEQTSGQWDNFVSFFGQANIEKIEYYDDSEGDHNIYYRPDYSGRENTWIDYLELNINGNNYVSFARVPVYYGFRGSSKVTSTLYKNVNGEYSETGSRFIEEWGLSWK